MCCITVALYDLLSWCQQASVHELFEGKKPDMLPFKYGENEIRDGILSVQTINLLLNERKSLSGNAWPEVVTAVQTIQGQYGSSNRGR